MSAIATAKDRNTVLNEHRFYCRALQMFKSGAYSELDFYNVLRKNCGFTKAEADLEIEERKAETLGL